MGAGQRRQYLACFLSQLSILVVGVAYSWFEPITIRLREDPELDLTAEDVSWLIAIVEVGSIVSPLVAGEVTNRLGRKNMILGMGPLCLLGWVMILYSKSMLILSAVRVIHGIAVGIAYTIAPIYTAEVAEPGLRGRITGSFQTAWYVGTMYAFCLGPYLSYDNFAYACLPLPVVFMASFWFMPETPYYLLMNGRVQEARRVLEWFRGGADVEEELASMEAAVREEMKQEASWSLLLTDPVERKALIIVQIVCITKFLTGMPVIANYAMETFAMSDSFLPPEEMSMLLGALLTLIAVFSAFMSDWIGRKPLLLISCFGCFFSHILTAAYYYLHEKTSVDAAPYAWLMYLGMAMYCFFSDIGMGPLLQTLQSEMFGASTRGVASGITEGFAALLCLVILKAYSPVNVMFGVYMNFLFYSAVGLLGGLLLIWLMYETAGKTIGQMEQK